MEAGKERDKMMHMCAVPLLTVSRQAAGAAALQRRLLLVVPQELRPPALRLPDVEEDAREASDPAVLVVGGGRAARLGVAQHAQHRQQAPGDVHCA